MKTNKIRPTLQRMIYDTDDGMIDLVCCVNMIERGGEFTLCGFAIPDTNMEIDGFEKVGKEFEGSIKDITCPNCLKHINYIKSLK